MNVKLHLMNDRKIIATEIVTSSVSTPFKKLMDALILDLDNNYVSEQVDVHKLAVRVMKTEALAARRNPPKREKITEFYTGDPASPQHYYSVVSHASA